MSDVKQIERLIAARKLEEAFTQMKALDLDSHFQNTLTVLQARWSLLMRLQRMGLISANEEYLEENRLTALLLSTLSEIRQYYPESVLPLSPKPTKTKAPKIVLLYSTQDQPQAKRFTTLLRSLQRNGHLGELHSIELTSERLDQTTFLPKESNHPEVSIMLVSASSVDLLHQAMKKDTAEVNQLQSLFIAVLLDVNVPFWDLESETAALHILPKNQKPVAQWKTADEAWLAVIKGLKDLIKERFNPRSVDVKQ